MGSVQFLQGFYGISVFFCEVFAGFFVGFLWDLCNFCRVFMGFLQFFCRVCGIFCGVFAELLVGFLWDFLWVLMGSV